MRKFILVAAMLLASASAQAGVSRSLILAANDEVTPPAPATTTTTAPAPPATTPAITTPSTDTPKFVERPAVAPPATPTTTTPATPAKTTTTGTPKTTKPVASDPKADKAKRRRDTEARVIYELHRHGIYW